MTHEGRAVMCVDGGFCLLRRCRAVEPGPVLGDEPNETKGGAQLYTRLHLGRVMGGINVEMEHIQVIEMDEEMQGGYPKVTRYPNRRNHKVQVGEHDPNPNKKDSSLLKNVFLFGKEIHPTVSYDTCVRHLVYLWVVVSTMCRNWGGSSSRERERTCLNRRPRNDSTRRSLTDGAVPAKRPIPCPRVSLSHRSKPPLICSPLPLPPRACEFLATPGPDRPEAPIPPRNVGAPFRRPFLGGLSCPIKPPRVTQGCVAAKL